MIENKLTWILKKKKTRKSERITYEISGSERESSSDLRMIFAGVV
jgi:hypothetical protein